jgi:hypothetical protein
MPAKRKRVPKKADKRKTHTHITVSSGTGKSTFVGEMGRSLGEGRSVGTADSLGESQSNVRGSSKKP